MVVEWGRFCYGSIWHLFRDNPSLATAGRYYFAEPGTPHVPGSHNLASRDWHDKNWTTTVTLGEDITAPHTWDEGVRPAVLPLNRFVGSQTCIANGELAADAAQPSQLDDGFPLACYAAPAETDPRWHEIGSFNSCSMQRFYAKIIEWIGWDDETSIVEAFTAFLGDDVQIRLHKAVGLLPGVATVIHPLFSICCVDGTRSAQQLALQAFTAVQRPTNIGIYGTVPLWYTASSYVNDCLQADGQAPGTPIMFAGHSYGGATVQNIVARYKHGTPTRHIRYMTFGSPKPGDQRLHDLVASCPGINLANDGDLVTVLPPDYLTLLPVMLLIGHPEMIVFRDWQRPPVQTLQSNTGELSTNESPVLDSITLAAMFANVLAHLPQAPIFEHRITEYYRRIAHRCPEAEWPISEEIIDILDEPEVEIGLTTAAEADYGSLGLWQRKVHVAEGELGLAAPLSGDQGGLGLSVPAEPSVLGLDAPHEAGQGGASLTVPLGTDQDGLALESPEVEEIVGGTSCPSPTAIEANKWYTVRKNQGDSVWFAMPNTEIPAGYTHIEVSVAGLNVDGILVMLTGACGTLDTIGFTLVDGEFTWTPFWFDGDEVFINLLDQGHGTGPINVVFRLRPLP